MKRYLLAAGAALALGIGPATAQDPVKIGFISTFSGPVAVIATR